MSVSMDLSILNNPINEGWANFLALGPHLEVDIVFGPHYSDHKKRSLL